MNLNIVKRTAVSILLFVLMLAGSTGILTNQDLMHVASAGVKAADKISTSGNLALGTDFAGYIDDNGTLWMWGSNKYGQLGTGNTNSHSTPVKVMENVKAVSFGKAHSMALKQDGTLWTWGANQNGQLGNETVRNASKPQQIMTKLKFNQISAGTTHSAAIQDNGSLWSWGSNNFGELGNITSGQSVNSKPVQILKDKKFSKVELGDSFSTAIEASNAVLWGWGRNNYRQISPESSKAAITEPVKITSSVKDVSAGSSRLGIIKEGSLYFSGLSLDAAASGEAKAYTSLMKVLDGVSQVSVGSDHIAVIKNDGTLWMIGANRYGQLGDGKTQDSEKFTQVSGEYLQAAAGTALTGAVKKDASVYTWGINNSGQLGIGESSNTAQPVQVKFTNTSTKTNSTAQAKNTVKNLKDNSKEIEQQFVNEHVNYYKKSFNKDFSAGNTERLEKLSKLIKDNPVRSNYNLTDDLNKKLNLSLTENQTYQVVFGAILDSESFIHSVDNTFINEIKLSSSKALNKVLMLLQNSSSYNEAQTLVKTLETVEYGSGDYQSALNKLCTIINAELNANSLNDVFEAAGISDEISAEVNNSGLTALSDKLFYAIYSKAYLETAINTANSLKTFASAVKEDKIFSQKDKPQTWDSQKEQLADAAETFAKEISANKNGNAKTWALQILKAQQSGKLMDSVEQAGSSVIKGISMINKITNARKAENLSKALNLLDSNLSAEMISRLNTTVFALRQLADSAGNNLVKDAKYQNAVSFDSFVGLTAAAKDQIYTFGLDFVRAQYNLNKQNTNGTNQESSKNSLKTFELSQLTLELKNDQSNQNNIACHTLNTIKTATENKTYTGAEQKNLEYHSYDSSVQLTVKDTSGRALAVISNDDVSITDGYENYFDFIPEDSGMTEFTKTMIIPSDYEVEFLGTQDDTMEAAVAKNNGKDFTGAFEYNSIPVKNGETGEYIENSEDPESYILLMGEEEYKPQNINLNGGSYNWNGSNIENRVTNLTLSENSLGLQVGEEHVLHVTLQPSNATYVGVNWKSSNPGIVTVDSNGKVRAVRAGTARITAVSKDNAVASDTCYVTVGSTSTNGNTSTNGLVLNSTHLTIQQGLTGQLTAAPTSANLVNSGINWSSSNPSVATVSNGTVRGLKKGTVTVTASAVGDPSVNASAIVTVVQRQSGVYGNTSIRGISLNTSRMNLTRGSSARLIATITPYGAANQRVHWSSSNSRVASVNNGVVRGVGSGSAVITATTADGQHSARCYVSVDSRWWINPSVSIDKSDDIYLTTLRYGKRTANVSARVTPGDWAGNVHWRTSAPNVVEVRGRGQNATLVARGEGVATVTAGVGSRKHQITVHVNNGRYIADQVKVTAKTPDHFVVNVVDVKANPALHYSGVPQKVSVFAWSESDQKDMNAKMAVRQGRNWVITIPVNDNTAHNYFNDAANIKIHAYASDNPNDVGELIGSTSYNWVDPENIHPNRVASIGYSQDIGFVRPSVLSGIAGTTGRAKQLEGLRVSTNIPDVQINTKVHAAGIGWMNSVPDGTYAGTMGQARRLEALQFTLSGPRANQYYLEYRVHAKDLGWMPWVNTLNNDQNNVYAGTTGQSRRIEAFEIRIKKK